MADPFTIGYAILGVALSGAAAMGQASAASSAAAAQQAEYQDQAQQAQLAADEEERARREQLNRSLSAQNAAAAAMGIDISRSGSFTAIQDYDKTALDREVLLLRTSAASTQYRFGLMSDAAGTQKTSAILGGLASFGGSLFTAYDMYSQLKTPAPAASPAAGLQPNRMHL